jgi:Flp pilus assembly protein TadD
MRTVVRATLFGLASILLALPDVATAQTPAPATKKDEFKRPKLEAGADSNDALSYYRLGNAQLRRDPETADRAFYWASRLAPSWADPYYGRWAATVLQYRGRGSKAQRERADSLETLASIRNPFLFRRLDRQVLEELVSRAVDPEYVGEYMLTLTQSHGDAASEAFNAYQNSKFEDAVRLYAKAIGKSTKRPSLHEDRALAFYQLQRYDSAAAELDAFLAAARVREDTALLRGYLSKAFAEYQLGSLHLLRGDTVAAREAFGRTLSEDLTYAPAHVALSGLALDVPTALAESEAATQVQEQDPVLHYEYARVLIAAGRADEAERELKRAQALEPCFALPYFLLARLYDASEMQEEASAQYASFLSRGARMMQEYGIATTRLAALRASASPPPAAAPAPPPPGKGG